MTASFTSLITSCTFNPGLRIALMNSRVNSPLGSVSCALKRSRACWLAPAAYTTMTPSALDMGGASPRLLPMDLPLLRKGLSRQASTTTRLNFGCTCAIRSNSLPRSMPSMATSASFSACKSVGMRKLALLICTP